MKIKMHKIQKESTNGFFIHFNNCGRLYLGRHQIGGFRL